MSGGGGTGGVFDGRREVVDSQRWMVDTERGQERDHEKVTPRVYRSAKHAT